MANPNATNPVTRASGDRNESSPTKSETAEERRRRQEDLERQAKGTQAGGPKAGSS
jgi:hypothetical protein